MRSAPAIGFEYRPSRGLAAVAVSLTALAVAAIAISGLAWPIRIALAILAAGYGAFAVRRFWRSRVRALTWRGDGSVSVKLADRHGAEMEVQGSLQDARVIGPLIVLQLRWRGGRASLWLLPDNLDADTRRRLRMRLALDGARPSVNADSV